MVAGKELDLYVLYHEVCKQGGVEAVVKYKRWKKVTVALDLPSTCTNAAYTLRKNYYRWLYAFECLNVHNIVLSNEEVPGAFFSGNAPLALVPHPELFCQRPGASSSDL